MLVDYFVLFFSCILMSTSDFLFNVCNDIREEKDDDRIVD